MQNLAGGEDSAAEILREMRARAAHQMDQAAGSASVCSYTKAGTPVPALKYAEGQWAALRELKSRGVDRTVAERLSAEWRDQLLALQSRGASSDWLAYRSGGVDALLEFAERTAHLSD